MDIRRFEHYTDETPEDLAELYYGSLRRLYAHETPEPTDFVLPELMSGSDYAGESVTVSNHRVFLDMFKAVPGVFDVYGGAGTYAIAIRRDALDNEEIADVLRRLEDYPVLDEDDHSYVESEAESEAWDSWACSDFRRMLADKYGDWIHDLTDDFLFCVFHAMAETANVYWENEQGNGAWIDLDRIMAD